MKVAIVTGANGFIGKAVCKALLHEGITVYAVVRNAGSMSDIQHPLLHNIEAELTDYTILPTLISEEIDVFYHFAWEGTSGSILGDYSQQIKNIQYTCDALIAAHHIGCKKFILAGTINELELIQFFHAENNSPRLACNYGISKLSCDLMCKTIASNIGIQYNTAIIGSCFGPGDKSKRIHNVFIVHMLKGTRPKLVEATDLHDWIYVDDVADMFCAIGNKSINMKNYYIGHNKLRTLRDILIDVRSILNPSLDIVFGEIRTSFHIDYSLINIHSVYEDTCYTCNSDFKTNILKTAEWLLSNDFVGI
jgi:nucleoside-diphosphate-sugar epimerase